MWTTPKKHTKKRKTLRYANQNKTTRRAGYKKVYEKPPPKKKKKRKYSELKEPLLTIVCEITLPQAVTCGLPLKSTLRREKH